MMDYDHEGCFAQLLCLRQVDLLPYSEWLVLCLNSLHFFDHPNLTWWGKRLPIHTIANARVSVFDNHLGRIRSPLQWYYFFALSFIGTHEMLIRLFLFVNCSINSEVLAVTSVTSFSQA